MAELEPDGREVQVGNVTLRTPGLRGVADAFDPGLDGLRGPEAVDDEVVDLMGELGLERIETIQISHAMEEPAAPETPRRSPYGEPAIEVDVPSPNEEFEQVVLYTDESGVTTWNFAQDATGAQDVTRGGAPRTYVLRRFVPPAGETVAGETRGALGSLGSKLIRVLAFRIIDPVVGGLADTFVDRWEASKHPYRLRTFTVDDKATPGTTLERPDLDFFRSGRALLLIHGTGSNTQEGLGGMDAEALAGLHERYEGRVLAFDHPTIGTAPRENAIELLLQLDGQGWDLDIVCHSRGGLVARMLIEQASALGEMPDKLKVGKVVFAGVPNAGTPLADARHLQAFVDSYTTMLNVLGAGIPVVATLGSIVAVVKQLAASALNGLDGLQSMNPGGPFLATLNSGPAGPEAYFALASNYEPPPGSGLAAFRDAVTDAVFNGKPNDLVVPTTGVFDLGATFDSQRFPVVAPRVHQFDPAASLDHSSFFRNPTGAAQILTWLSE